MDKMVLELSLYPSPMRVYTKMLRRIISHPGYARKVLRKFLLHREDSWGNRYCLCCWCYWGQHKHKKQKSWVYLFRCTHCKKVYSEFKWSIFDRTKVPLHIWCEAILHWCISTGSLSAAELARLTGISHPSAWKLLMKIRQACTSPPDSILSWICEIDESWHGKTKNDNQDIVFGIVQRTKKQLLFFCVENTQKETLFPLIYQHITPGSKVFSDGYQVYKDLHFHYRHKTVIHSEGEFSRDEEWEKVHSNTQEQIWWDFKGITQTIHHGIKKKYRKLYLAQYQFRYNYWKTGNLFYALLERILFKNQPVV